MADVRIQDEGSLVIVYPESDAARVWMAEHLADAAKWCGGYAVGHAYIDNVLAGMVADGLDVEVP